MEFLKQLFQRPLSFEEFSKAVAENGVKLADLSTGNYVSKAKFLDVSQEAKRLKEQMESQSAAKGQGDAEALETLKMQYQQETEALRKELFEVRRDGAIDLALEKLGAKNKTAVRALLDLDSITLSEDGVEGLSDQLETIRRDNGFLFHSTVVSTGMKQGNSIPAVDEFVQAARNSAGLI